MTNGTVRFSFIIAGMLAATLCAAPYAHAQSARSVPVFEVDPSWPKVPPQSKVGDASSFAIDAHDNVWLLHRPATVKKEDAANAAKPVMVFDSAGNFVRSWGGEGGGFDWPQREHGI